MVLNLGWVIVAAAFAGTVAMFWWMLQFLRLVRHWVALVVAGYPITTPHSDLEARLSATVQGGQTALNFAWGALLFPPAGYVILFLELIVVLIAFKGDHGPHAPLVVDCLFGVLGVATVACIVASTITVGVARAGGRLRRWRKCGFVKNHPGRRNRIFNADTVPVVAISALPILLFLLAGAFYGVCVLVWAVATGNTSNDRLHPPHWWLVGCLEWFLYVLEPCLFLAGAVATAVSLVRGVQARRLTTDQVSQSRFVGSALVILGVGVALTGKSPLWFTALGCVACLVVLFAVRTRHRTVLEASLTRTTAAVPEGRFPVYPDSVNTGHGVVPMVWHLPTEQDTARAGSPAAAWVVLGDASGVQRQVPVGVRIDYDSTYWYKAPCSPEGVDAWVQATLEDLNRRYGLSDDRAEAHGLLRKLTQFVTADSGSPNRLIHFGDEPLGAPIQVVCPITVDLTGRGASQGMGAQLAADNPGGGTTVDAQTGLVRYDSYTSEDGGQLLGVRYHRRVLALSTDIVLTCEGIPVRDVPTMLPRLDALAGGITVIGPDGQAR